MDNIISKVLPTSRTDALALKHDVDYLIGSGDDYITYIADKRAIEQADFSLQGSSMKAGLIARSVLNLPFNRRQVGAPEAGLFVKDMVKQSPYYQRNFKRFGVNLVDW